MKKLFFYILLLLPGILNAQLPGGIVDISSMAPPQTILITTNLGSLSPFSTTAGTASSAQVFTTSAFLLTTTGTVTAPSGFEVSLDNVTYASTRTIPISTGSFTGQPVAVYVRIAAATSVGSYSGNVTVASTGATTRNVAVSGSVTSLTPFLTVTGSFSAFSTTTGTASATQNVTVSGGNLTNDCIITWPTSFEGSIDGGSTWGTTRTITHSGTVLPSQPVTVGTRIAASASAGSPSGNVAFASTGATTQNVAASGSVGSGSANDTINVNLTDGQSAASMHQTKWNNWSPTIQVTTNQTSPTFNYATGTASPSITATITQNVSTSANYYDNTLAYATGNTSGYPDTAFRIPMGWFDDGPDSLIINNLPTAANNYTVIIGSSRNTSSDRTQTITCNGASTSFNAQNNINNVVRFSNVVKNGSNKIIIIFLPDTGHQTSGNRASYLNFFTIIKNN